MTALTVQRGLWAEEWEICAIKEWVSTIKDTISTAVNEQVKERLNTGKPTSTATNLNANDDPFAAIAAKYK